MKVKKLGAGAVAVAGLAAASLGVGGAHVAASAADPACTAGSTKLIETIPAVTHGESRYAKTVHHDAVGEPTVSVKVKDAVAEISHTDYVYRSLSGRVHLAHKDDGRVVVYDWVLYFRTGQTTKHVVVPAQAAVFEDRPNPDYRPAYDETVYYTGKPGGSASLDDAAWVRYVPTGWPQQVETRTVTDIAEQYVCDVTRPVTTLTNPATPVQPSYVFDLETTDDHAVAKTVGNVYSGSTLVKSNQAPGGSLAVPADFPDGSYSLRYNGLDSVGNMASTGSFAFVVDGTGPTVTNKGADAASYRSVSFKLFDANKVDRFTLNGYAGNLSDNTWSDLNDIHPGWYGAKEGANTLTVYDIAGNATTVTFTLDTAGPQVTEKEGSSDASRSFKLHDPSKVTGFSLNGHDYDLADNVWSDLNAVTPGRYGAVAGENTLVVRDVLGNETTVTFTLQ